MIRRYGTILRAALVVFDGVLAAAVLLAADLLARSFAGASAAFAPPLLLGAAYVAVWLFLLWSNGLYRLRARWSLRSEARAVLRSAATLGVGALAFLFLADAREVSRLFVVALFPIQAAVTIVSRGALRALTVQLREHGRNTRFVVIVGTDYQAARFADALEEHRGLGLRVIGFVGQPSPFTDGRYLGPVDSIKDVLHERVVDEVAICVAEPDWADLEPVIQLCEDEGKIVRIPLQTPPIALRSRLVEEIDGMPVVSLMNGPDRTLGLAAKRLIDITVAIAALLLTAPLTAAIALAILVTDGRPVLFRQQRVGLHGRRFALVKFRTMVPDAESQLERLRPYNEVSGPAFKLARDPRVTPLGRLLRRTSLDELPQLWNVLKADMSLVGPRPPLPTEVEQYDVWHRRRLSMKPGMTGLWQVDRRRDREFDGWVEKDLEYIDRWSLWLDLKICARTIPRVLRADGV